MPHDYATLPRIDAHAHWDLDGAMADEAADLLRSWGIRIHNICVAADPAGQRLAMRRRIYRHLHQAHPDIFAWTTSFDCWRWQEPDFVARATAQLDEDFAAGAVGVKIWRSIGMAMRRPDRSYVMMDDPIFDPIYAFVASRNRTLLVHISEPKLRWLTEEQRSRPVGLYRQNPSYSRLVGNTTGAGGFDPAVDFPPHEAQIAACDRVISRHPDLRVVGAHFASTEYDVRELAARMARHPNLAVDTSGRRRDVAAQDRDAVRAFFMEYQDRILWGMDQGASGPITPQNVAERWPYVERSNREGYALEFALYESDGPVTFDGLSTQGLALPQDVLTKIYRDNVMRWYPGIFANMA